MGPISDLDCALKLQGMAGLARFTLFQTCRIFIKPENDHIGFMYYINLLNKFSTIMCASILDLQPKEPLLRVKRADHWP